MGIVNVIELNKDGYVCRTKGFMELPEHVFMFIFDEDEEIRIRGISKYCSISEGHDSYFDELCTVSKVDSITGRDIIEVLCDAGEISISSSDKEILQSFAAKLEDLSFDRSWFVSLSDQQIINIAKSYKRSHVQTT